MLSKAFHLPKLNELLATFKNHLGVSKMKICCTCKSEKDISLFHKNKSSFDGLTRVCKDCYKDYYLNNKNRIACINNSRIEQRALVNKNWRELNKEHLKIYDSLNKQKKAKRAVKYRLINRNSINLKSKEHYYANKHLYKARNNKRRSLIKKLHEHHNGNDINKLLITQKRKCIVCKKLLNNTYHVDHIQPISKGGSNCKYNIQILCPHCNLQKNAKDPIEFMQFKGYLL